MSCAGCGAKAGTDGVPLKLCPLCVDESVAQSTRYCSKECQKACWKEHKQWHQAQARLKASERESVSNTIDKKTRETLDRGYEYDRTHGSEYQQLVSRGKELSLKEGDYKAAAKKLRKAIKLDPEKPDAYYGLGGAYHNSNQFPQAAECFVDALDREPKKDSFEWALIAGSAYCAIRRCISSRLKVELPTWWNHATLIEMSDKMVAAAPDQPRVWTMRGEILMGSIFAEQVRIEHQQEALVCFRKAAKLSSGEPRVRAALLRQAQHLKDHMAQQDAAMRSSLDAWKAADESAGCPSSGKFLIQIGSSRACRDTQASMESADDFLAIEGLEDSVAPPRKCKLTNSDNIFIMCTGWLELGPEMTHASGKKCDGALLVNGVDDELKGGLWQPYLVAVSPGRFTLHLSASHEQELGIKNTDGYIVLADSGLRDANDQKVFSGRFCLTLDATKARAKNLGVWHQTYAMHFLAFHAPDGAHPSVDKERMTVTV